MFGGRSRLQQLCSASERELVRAREQEKTFPETPSAKGFGLGFV